MSRSYLPRKWLWTGLKLWKCLAANISKEGCMLVQKGTAYITKGETRTGRDSKNSSSKSSERTSAPYAIISRGQLNDSFSVSHFEMNNPRPNRSASHPCEIAPLLSPASIMTVASEINAIVLLRIGKFLG